MQCGFSSFSIFWLLQPHGWLTGWGGARLDGAKAWAGSTGAAGMHEQAGVAVLDSSIHG